MSSERTADWDPATEEVMRDQRAAFDVMRESCPVAYSDAFQWSVFRHEDIVRILRDHETFSNAVSEYKSVPNGMDPPEHTEYRRIIERYFSSERMQAFAPVCRQIASRLISQTLANQEIELMADFGRPFAARAQCAFLGWPAELAGVLAQWTTNNQRATHQRDRQALSDLAREFEEIIDTQLKARRHDSGTLQEDVTLELMNEQVRGRTLSNEETASILRNWTGGEVATLAASIGILVHFLAADISLQDELRSQPSLLPVAIDEILRIDGPLVLNRRMTTRAVELGGRSLEAGERLSLMWISGNRDPRAFPDPGAFRWDRDPKLNLLWGDGIHACPGAPLARLEMVTFLEELLKRTTRIRVSMDRLPTRAAYPGGGFSQVFVDID
jgi:cytochrome P450